MAASLKKQTPSLVESFEFPFLKEMDWEIHDNKTVVIIVP